MQRPIPDLSGLTDLELQNRNSTFRMSNFCSNRDRCAPKYTILMCPQTAVIIVIVNPISVAEVSTSSPAD